MRKMPWHRSMASSRLNGRCGLAMRESFFVSFSSVFRNSVRLPMIVFDLTCGSGHAFEGWFQSAEVFEAQLARDMIACPHCGSTDIRRVPSAIRFSRSKDAGHEATGRDASAKRQAGTAQTAREAVLSLFDQVLSSIIANTEDVGQAFAEEARRMHYLEVPERPIRGEASLEEYESLKDEGIEVILLPLMKKKKTH